MKPADFPIMTGGGALTRLAAPPKGFGRKALLAHRDHAQADQVDFYPTPPCAARACARLILELDPQARSVWEPACGAGHMAHGLRDYFAQVHVSDAYPYTGNPIFNFTSDAAPPVDADWVFTNPPFAHIEAFIRKGYVRARRGLALLMRAAVLETQGRHELLSREVPLSVFAPFSERVPMHKGRWEPDGSTAAFYALFVWLKPGVRGFRAGGRPVIRWIPPGVKATLTHPDDARLFGSLDRSRGQG